MQNIGIFYGSTTGNTEKVAELMKDILGNNQVKIHEVSGASSQDIDQYTNIIFGASTWGIGDLQDDFEMFLQEIASVNFEGKKIAIFGLGDQYSYSDSFVDGIGTIYKILKAKGCEIIGSVPTNGYDFEESKAIVDGSFVGLPLDEDNQGNLTEERIKNWLENLKTRFN